MSEKEKAEPFADRAEREADSIFRLIRLRPWLFVFLFLVAVVAGYYYLQHQTPEDSRQGLSIGTNSGIIANQQGGSSNSISIHNGPK